ncbi:MAG: outer membrane protein transport protein [Alcaligenaceae bacterium]|nr:outer membrane protein transport protein [Alcaligenaceae bacterium]
MKFRLKKHALALLLLNGTVISTASAAGFQLMEQNASGLGNAYAGSGVVAENASGAFFNPASMTFLPGLNVSGGFNLIRPSFKFTDSGQSTGPLALGGLKTAGPGGDAGNLGFVPNFHITYQATQDLFLGLSVGAPFGLKTSYRDNDWIGNYHSRDFDIRTININPSIAYRVTPNWSVGAGLGIQRIRAEYRLGTLIPHPHPLMAGSFLPGDAEVKMKDTAVGWNIGTVFQPTESTRIGLSYRSRIKHKATGHTDVNFNGDRVANFKANTTIELPDIAKLSVSHQLTPRWMLLGDISWTGWSSIPELVIKNTGGPENSLPLRFRDTWRFAVGAQYKINDAWTWKVGIATDKSPIPNEMDRPTSLPDNNRLWLSTGVQYKRKNLAVDVGYTYLHIKKTKINNHELAVTRGIVHGHYDGDAHLFGVQFSYRF